MNNPRMDNHFLAHDFDWSRDKPGGLVHFANRVLGKLKTGLVIQKRMDGHSEMTNLEQRISLWHLSCRVLEQNIDGDFAEFGCFDGKTATIFGRVLQAYQSPAKLHLFDHFQIGFHLSGRDIKQEVIQNFQAVNCPLAELHDGDFKDSVPAQLPEKIAFSHIDCGFGGDHDVHQAVVERLLENIYPRMPVGGICVLMDYRDETLCTGYNWNPGAGKAATAFLADKPENMVSLYAGEYCHGYFVKQG